MGHGVHPAHAGPLMGVAFFGGALLGGALSLLLRRAATRLTPRWRAWVGGLGLAVAAALSVALSAHAPAWAAALLWGAGGTFFLLLMPPRQDRRKGRGQRDGTA